MLLGVALLSLSLSASAADRQAARRLFERASSEYQRHDYQKALNDFSSAYRLAPVPEILFNLAQCEFELNHPRVAATYYRRFLEARPKARNAEQVRARLAELDTEERKTSPPEVARPPEVIAAPPAAVTEPPHPKAPSTPSHALSLTFSAGAAVATVMAGYGLLRVVGYDQLASEWLTPPGIVPVADYQLAKQTYVNAQHWVWGSAALAVVAAGAVTAAVYTW